MNKGDAVAIYMPMVCELPIAMLACARIGAVHSVVFGGFSADSLASRYVSWVGEMVYRGVHKTCSAIGVFGLHKTCSVNGIDYCQEGVRGCGGV